MLFSYTLLFSMLTTFVAAAPASLHSPAEHTPTPDLSEDQPPELHAPTKLLEAAKYLNYDSRPLFEVGWTRIPSASESVSRFLLFVERLR